MTIIMTSSCWLKLHYNDLCQKNANMLGKPDWQFTPEQKPPKRTSMSSMPMFSLSQLLLFTIFCRRGEDIYRYSDILTLLRPLSKATLSMHCGRLSYSVAFHEYVTDDVLDDTSDDDVEVNPRPVLFEIYSILLFPRCRVSLKLNQQWIQILPPLQCPLAPVLKPPFNLKSWTPPLHLDQF